ncbi:MAG: aspartate aminotransferase family protein [Sandaracinus sp.]|nr:aspartate aminotransferase family protein [Sandaracinus sp.]MCB9620200.1 aspartate aminotransferase family protein [Sandaracinus sp.]
MRPALGSSPPHLVAPPPGPRSRALVDVLARTECPAFTARRARRAEASGAPQDPIVWSEAAGSNVVDADGNVYVDLTSGFGVAAIGHAHPRVVAAIEAQSKKLLHALGDLHPSDVKIALLDRLAALAPFPGARVVLSQSGSDAVETALKTAVLATKKSGVLAFEGGYHGLSHGPLAACGYSLAFRAPFADQLGAHVRFATWHETDLDAALASVDATWRDDVGAVLVEPLQGRGGCRPCPDGFLEALSRRCAERGALLVVDEILTGLGRCGAPFLSVSLGATPDLVVVGKALGGGLPVSACLGRAEAMAAWGDPAGEAIHTGTFFGHPLGCAAALAALDVLEDESLAARAHEVGARFATKLAAATGRPVTGAGLLLGVRFERPVLDLVARLLARGYLTLPAGADARTLQLAPALTVDEALLDGFVVALAEELT